VEPFLADYLEIWDGQAYQKEILQLFSCSLHLQHFDGLCTLIKHFKVTVYHIWHNHNVYECMLTVTFLLHRFAKLLS